jgi:hypothetical protein
MMHFSADKALGVFGGGLAAASVAFGVYMNIHGPAASFGKSHDFTVFAQLSGPRSKPASAEPTATIPRPGDALDMTATASIGQRGSTDPTLSGEARLDPNASILASVTLERVHDDTATIMVDGQARTVRIGDTLPNAGEVLEIHAGPRPSVRTSLGLIMSVTKQ